jgi:D-glycero-alpha-D-manno-heptose 1-phosphate guanylyltransferase
MVQDIIILAGGFGKRLESVSQDVPKPLIRIGSHVFLDYILDWLSKFDLKKIILSLHYKPEQFVSYIKKRGLPIDIVPLIEPIPMGTGGAIKFVLQNVHIADPFCVLNGDTYLEFDLQDMFRGRFGAVFCEEDRVLSYSEKMKAHSGWINNGCYFFKKSVFEAYKGNFSIELDLFPCLVKKKLLSVYKTSGEFFDIGVPEDYERFVKRFSR